MPAGRPKIHLEGTEVVAIRITKELGERLNRYIDRMTSRRDGGKASRNSVAGSALEDFLDRKDREYASTRKELPQVQPVTPQPSGNLRQKLENMSSNRRRIIDLLEKHPAGLSPVDVRAQLKAPKDLGPTMKNMATEGLLSRIRAGCYAVAEDVLETLKKMEK